MTETFKSVQGSTKVAHQLVMIDQEVVGEVWRENVHVVTSKLTEPRKMALKSRWFSRQDGFTVTLGKGTRVAMLLGAGFKSRAAAVDEIKKMISSVASQK